MRAALALLAVLVLASCLPWGERAAAPSGDEIAVTVLAPAAVAGVEAGQEAAAASEEAARVAAEAGEAPPVVAGPAAEAPPPPAEAEAAEGPPVPPILAAEARACERRGGTLRPRGAGGLWSCLRVTRDAGRRCTTGAECEGLCLARSGSCAPYEPLFGCHEALDRAGRPETVCRD